MIIKIITMQLIIILQSIQKIMFILAQQMIKKEGIKNSMKQIRRLETEKNKRKINKIRMDMVRTQRLIRRKNINNLQIRKVKRIKIKKIFNRKVTLMKLKIKTFTIKRMRKTVNKKRKDK